MKKIRFLVTEHQGIKEYESARNVQELCRVLGIITAAFYNWCQYYRGLLVNELKMIKELEKEIILN